ncbi:hypothetical protein SAMN04489727_8082 [Amycolatopsis tolypomycina]|uniref:Uncharacterized protein n=1 Tax=Amycolatopsis tolypomycina TaxID=208445 RepID=A0A1H5B597_9PSEU|nr:hypothetical protein [Amycolatopsis tolypomycina]SED49090.1 hypothetical protein SAMN04489727_8082 [Amycolatopsis tolypomycina]
MSTPTDVKPEEAPEPVGQAGPEPDEHGWVHIDHVPEKPKDGPIVVPNCGNPCYQVVKP